MLGLRDSFSDVSLLVEPALNLFWCGPGPAPFLGGKGDQPCDRRRYVPGCRHVPKNSFEDVTKPKTELQPDKISQQGGRGCDSKAYDDAKGMLLADWMVFSLRQLQCQQKDCYFKNSDSD